MRDNYDGRAGRETREPKLIQRDYLVLSKLSKLFKTSVEKYLLEQNAMILDIGCGEKPYQPFFLGRGAIYLGIDTKLGKFVDILCDGKKLPLKDNAFSACVCIQVLEHIDEPIAATNEIHRVLKADGLLFLSTHGNWAVHGAPYDFWRWTEYGLRKLLVNFHIHGIHKCGGSAASIIQLLELYISKGTLGVICFLFMNKLGDLLDKVQWLNARLPNLTTNYFVVARKIDT